MPSDQSSAKPGGIEFYGGYQVYSDTGVDLTLLRRNLELSIEERLERNARMLPLIEALTMSGAARSQGRTKPGRRPSMLEVEALLRQLSNSRVAYVLIGGLAMRAQGSAHITEDLDICYARSASNLDAIAAALAPLHPYLRGAPRGLPFCLDAATLQAGLNFTLDTDLGDVALIGEVSGVGTYEQAYAQSDEQIMFGLTVRVLSLEGLIAAKRAAGRVKDRGHLLELEELKKMRDANPGG